MPACLGPFIGRRATSHCRWRRTVASSLTQWSQTSWAYHTPAACSSASETSSPPSQSSPSVAPCFTASVQSPCMAFSPTPYPPPPLRSLTSSSRFSCSCPSCTASWDSSSPTRALPTGLSCISAPSAASPSLGSCSSTSPPAPCLHRSCLAPSTSSGTSSPASPCRTIRCRCTWRGSTASPPPPGSSMASSPASWATTTPPWTSMGRLSSFPTSWRMCSATTTTSAGIASSSSPPLPLASCLFRPSP
mmetsp:Transcript_17709/g.49551  ORF Transcript_17709/g.49551 Transcript_17709/m.49551 type:complete len:247 (-) Transcript_17709:343-1083(-)